MILRILPYLLILWGVTLSYGNRYALLIGRNSGGKNVDSLRFAEKDAQQFSKLLVNMAGFKNAHIITLLSPDKAAITQGFRNLSQLVKEKGGKGEGGNDLFLFYYSGHADGDRLDLGNTSFSLKELHKEIGSFPTQIKVAVYDACQSGALTRFKGGTMSDPFYLESQKQVEGQIIIASSASNEQAQESDELKGSIFSHHWFNGLRGSADRSGDRKVTLQEAYQYAYGKTVETTALTGGGVQHPSYQFKIYGQGEIVLTDLSQGQGGVLFNKDFSGRHLVLNDNYSSVVADFYKKKGQEIYIALSPGLYTVINRRGRESALHHFSIDEKSTYHIAPDSFYINPLTYYTSKGASPYVVKKAVEVETSPLVSYSGGFLLGNLTPIRKSLGDLNINHYQFGFANTYYLKKRYDLTLDFSWIHPTNEISSEIGFNYYMTTSRFRSLMGAELGLASRLNIQNPSQRTTGPFIGLKMGFLMDVSEFLQMGVQVPYRMNLNKEISPTIGLNLIFLFSSPMKKIKKLNY